MFYALVLILGLVYFIGSPVGLSFFYLHLIAVIVTFITAKEFSKYFFFWILFFIIFFTSENPRFSVEYFLLSSAFLMLPKTIGWDFHIKKKEILFVVFIFSFLLNKIGLNLSEKGSVLLWLPFYLSIYFESASPKNALVYSFSGIMVFFSNKFSTLLAFLTALRSKIVYFLFSFSMILFFVFKQNLQTFIGKSVEPRLYIWKAVFYGFLDKPIFGHGFGIFALGFPEYRFHGKFLGGKISEQIVHGHSLFTHYMFELGIVGLLLLFFLFYLVYLNKKEAFIPLFIISIFDTVFYSFGQFLLFSLIFSPFIKKYGILKSCFYEIKNIKIKTFANIILLFICFIIFFQSLIGHYYYSKNNLDKAIFFDRKNALYYFSRGADYINKNTIQSEKDFKVAISLSPSVPYFYGFLGAALLANGKIEESKKYIKTAMKMDGEDGYWCLLYSYANYKDKKIFSEYQKKAFKKNPEIKDLLLNPNATSTKYIGKSKYGDVRIAGFYRTGKKIFFPLPILE